MPGRRSILSTAASSVVQRIPCYTIDALFVVTSRQHRARHPAVPAEPSRSLSPPEPYKGAPELSRANRTLPLPLLEPLFSFNCRMVELGSVLAVVVAGGPRTMACTRPIHSSIKFVEGLPLISSPFKARNFMEWWTVASASSLTVGGRLARHAPCRLPDASPYPWPPSLVAARQGAPPRALGVLRRPPEQRQPSGTEPSGAVSGSLLCVLDARKGTASWRPAWRAGGADRRVRPDPAGHVRLVEAYFGAIRFPLPKAHFRWITRPAQPSQFQPTLFFFRSGQQIAKDRQALSFEP